MKVIICIAISLYFGFIAGIITNSIMLGSLVGIIFLIVFLTVILRMVQSFQKRARKHHETYRFINSFIVSLSVTESLDQAFEDASLETSGEERTLLENLVNLTCDERLEYLKSYFKSDLYNVFVSIVSLYVEQGGDILSLASNLLNEAALEENKQLQKESIARKALVQHSTLWLLSTAILGFLRYGLASFYRELSGSLPFIFLALIYFLIALAGIYFFTRVYTEEKPVLERSKRNVKEKAKSRSI